MTVGERQRLIIEDFGFIEDPRERFQLIVESGGSVVEPFPESLRVDANLVRGCVSRVWLAVWKGEGAGFEVRMDSESPALKAISALLCRLYSGATGEEILAIEPEFIEKLGIDRNLTPTRTRGLRSIRERLVESVERLMETPLP